MKSALFAGLVLCSAMASPALAEWNFSDSPTPNAFIQTSNSTLELQCDRIRFVPAGGAMEITEGISEPDPDLVFVRGYRFANDVCMLTGESAFTIDFLDDAADLVTCPTGHPAAAELVAETNASRVTQTNSFTLYSVPRR